MTRKAEGEGLLRVLHDGYAKIVTRRNPSRTLG